MNPENNRKNVLEMITHCLMPSIPHPLTRADIANGSEHYLLSPDSLRQAEAIN